MTCTCKLSCPPKHSGWQRSLKTNSGGIWLKCSKLFRSVTTLTSGAEIRCWRFECCGVFAWWEDRWELTLKRDQRGTLLLSQGASWGLVWPHHAPCCVQRWKENNMSMSASKRNKLKTKVFLALANNRKWPSLVWTIHLSFSAHKNNNSFYFRGAQTVLCKTFCTCGCNTQAST